MEATEGLGLPTFAGTAGDGLPSDLVRGRVDDMYAFGSDCWGGSRELVGSATLGGRVVTGGAESGMELTLCLDLSLNCSCSSRVRDRAEALVVSSGLGTGLA